MPLVEMFVVNLHPVRRRLLMDKTLKISFVRQEGDPGAVLEENIGGSNPKKLTTILGVTPQNTGQNC